MANASPIPYDGSVCFIEHSLPLSIVRSEGVFPVPYCGKDAMSIRIMEDVTVTVCRMIL